MSSALGLDLSRNVSLLTVPVAFVAALAPHAYAITSAGPGVFDNSNPRTFKDALTANQSIDKPSRQRILRAESASQNGFETLGFYAAAVVAANQAGVPARELNALALTYAASRFAFVGIYIWVNGNRRTGAVRSLAWFVGIGATIAMYVKAGLRVLDG